LRAATRAQRQTAICSTLAGISVDMQHFDAARDALEELLHGSLSGDVRSKFVALMRDAGAAPAENAGSPDEQINLQIKVEPLRPPPQPSVPAVPPPPRPNGEDGAARANATRPPDHYLKPPPEDWRAFVGADGVISPSPWRRF
jgi:hypothetical protein